MRNNRGKYISRGSKDISELGVAKSSTRVLPAGSIVFSSRAPIGYVAITENELYTNQGFKSVSFFTEGHQDFIYHALIGLTESIKQRASGTTFAEISGSEFGKTLIPLPPKRESSRIVKEIESYYSALEKIQDSRARYKRILSETPTSLRQQLIQAAIQGQLVPQNPNDEPASVLLERIAQERTAKLGKKAVKSMSRIERRGSKTYELFPDGSEKDISDDIPFDIPDSWEWSTIGLVSKNRDSERIPLSKAQRQGQSKIYDYYGASGIIDKVEGYIYDSRLLLIGEDGANLLSRSTDIAFIAEGKFWVNNHAHVLDSYKGISLDYLKHYINGISLVKYVTGSAQPKLTQDNLNAIIIPVPPTNEQLRIVEKIESILSTLAL